MFQPALRHGLTGSPSLSELEFDPQHGTSSGADLVFPILGPFTTDSLIPSTMLLDVVVERGHSSTFRALGYSQRPGKRLDVLAPANLYSCLARADFSIASITVLRRSWRVAQPVGDIPSSVHHRLPAIAHAAGLVRAHELAVAPFASETAHFSIILTTVSR